MAKIITVPDPILREISKPVASLDKKTIAIIHAIKETLSGSQNPRGVGLSGVQIGKPVRVFATYLPPSGDPEDEKTKPQIKIYINPEIIEASKEKTLGPDKKKPINEGCLSIPGIWGPVWRHPWIKLRYQTLTTLTQKSSGRDKFSQVATASQAQPDWQADLTEKSYQSKPSAAKKISVVEPSENQKIAATRAVTATFSAFPARVIQHELDHLNGILFIDHSLKDKLPLYEAKGEDLEPIDLPYETPLKNMVSDTAE